MLEITEFTCEGLAQGCVTDNKNPRFSFSAKSDRNGAFVKSAQITMGEWSKAVVMGEKTTYDGAPLAPFTEYTALLEIEDDAGETATESVCFETGRMDTPWTGKFITDGNYKFTEKRVSPKPMTFVRDIEIDDGKTVKEVKIYCTALGIYELSANGKKIGDEYFAPGFTSYKHTLLYNVYDATELLKNGGKLVAEVGGGWAVGSFVFTRKNRITAPRQALLCEVRITYDDGTVKTVGTDKRWQVTLDGRYKASDFYDGEVFDGRTDLNVLMNLHAAKEEKVKINPKIVAYNGSPVRAHEKMVPLSCTPSISGELIYDFGQNFAGVVCAKINGKSGQKITFRHAELLNADGTPNVKLLRSAKQTAVYYCRDGEQTYNPRLTYMGFRYVSVAGIEESDIELYAFALYSDIRQTGLFECSDERINRLQKNIVWSSKSNFMDIPTDCPQRDERMGWTGDIAVFAPTACYNFDMSRFLEKWLDDVKNEQLKSGGIPNTVPVQGYGFPATMPVMAVDFWGDACVLVPLAEYAARGDAAILKEMYPTMKKYVDACKFWAGFLSVGKRRYIWNTPGVLHFGDWLCPDLPKMSQWQARRNYTASASLCNTSMLVSKIAALLGKEEDAKKYRKLSEKAREAFRDVLTNGKGKTKEEFQTAYVLPLYYDIFTPQTKQAAADNLAELVKKNDYKIGTGFPGTPYILFALADNGHEEEAFKMLLNDECPSWLYEVKAGGTTIWERWDGLKADGTLNAGEGDGTGGMVSFNHYASGAVGDFLYRRVAGIEATEAGYKTSKIAPLAGYGLTYAKGSVVTPYGELKSEWKIENGRFEIEAVIPMNTRCELLMPSGKRHILQSGRYAFGEESAE